MKLCVERIFTLVVLTLAVSTTQAACPADFMELYSYNYWPGAIEYNPLSLPYVEIGTRSYDKGEYLLKGCNTAGITLQGLNWEIGTVRVWGEIMGGGEWKGTQSSSTGSTYDSIRSTSDSIGSTSNCNDYGVFKIGGETVLKSTFAVDGYVQCYPYPYDCIAPKAPSAGSKNGQVAWGYFDQRYMYGLEEGADLAVEFTHVSANANNLHCIVDCTQKWPAINSIEICASNYALALEATGIVRAPTAVPGTTVQLPFTKATYAVDGSVIITAGVETNDTRVSATFQSTGTNTWTGPVQDLESQEVRAFIGHDTDSTVKVLMEVYVQSFNGGNPPYVNNYLNAEVRYSAVYMQIGKAVVDGHGEVPAKTCQDPTPAYCYYDDTCYSDFQTCQALKPVSTCQDDTPVFCQEDETCVKSAVMCLGAESAVNVTETCPEDSFICWSSGQCTSPDACDPLPGCADPDYPVICPDASCAVDVSSCPDVDACDVGYSRCADGVCRNTTENPCPHFDGCSLESPVQCPNAECVTDPANCPSDDSCSGATPVTCWGGACAVNASSCPRPPYETKPVEIAVSDPVGTIEVPGESGGVVVNMTVESCLSDAGGPLEGRTLSVQGVAESEYLHDGVRSSVIGVTVWNATSGAPESEIQFGNLLVGLGVDFSSRVLVEGESRDNLCIAGLNNDGSWTCIINSGEVARLAAEGTHGCESSVTEYVTARSGMRQSGTSMRIYANSEEEVTAFSTFTEIVEEDVNGSGDDSGDDSGDEGVILPAGSVEVIAVLTVIAITAVYFVLRVYWASQKSAGKERPLALRPASFRYSETAVSTPTGSGGSGGLQFPPHFSNPRLNFGTNKLGKLELPGAAFGTAAPNYVVRKPRATRKKPVRLAPGNLQ